MENYCNGKGTVAAGYHLDHNISHVSESQARKNAFFCRQE